MSNRNAPKSLRNKFGAARRPGGFEQCWCRGFGIGCGLIRSSATRRLHEITEKRIRKGRISIMTRRIRRRSLTLQFLEKQAGILVDILNQLINDDDDKDHSGSPRDLQDEGVPVDNTNVNVDLEAGDDQPQDAMMG